MATYTYRVRTRNGQVLQGTMAGDSVGVVSQRLRSQGYIVLAVTSKSTAAFWQRMNEPRGKVPSATMSTFCRQLSVMLESGMAVTNAIQLVADQMRDKRLKAGLEQVRTAILAGSGLAAAMGAQSKVFPPMIVQMMEVGETVGALPDLLNRLSQYYEREADTKAKVREALMYPMVVACVAVLAVLVLTFFVLPNFVTIFADFQLQLPWTTKLLLNTTRFILRWWWAIGGILLVALATLARWLATPNGKKSRDTVLLKTPIMGGLISQFVFSRMCRSLSLMSRGAVPMVDALRIAERLVLNVPVAEAIARVRVQVERGASITTALTAEKIFPRLLTQMVAVGEETGSIDTTLDHVADFYDKEAAYTLKSVTSLIEPLIIVSMAGMVLFIALAVVVPMFQMSTSTPGGM